MGLLVANHFDLPLMGPPICIEPLQAVLNDYAALNIALYFVVPASTPSALLAFHYL